MPWQSATQACLTTGVPKETFDGEKRVALSPAGVSTLVKAGFQGVLIEKGAGAGAKFAVRWRLNAKKELLKPYLQYDSCVLQDADYEASGAKIVDTKEAFGQDIVLKVRPPKIEPEAGQFKDGARCLPLALLHPFKPWTSLRLA